MRWRAGLCLTSAVPADDPAAMLRQMVSTMSLAEQKHLLDTLLHHHADATLAGLRESRLPVLRRKPRRIRGFQVRLDLRHAKPSVWRRLILPGDLNGGFRSPSTYPPGTVVKDRGRSGRVGGVRNTRSRVNQRESGARPLRHRLRRPAVRGSCREYRRGGVVGEDGPTPSTHGPVAPHRPGGDAKIRSMACARPRRPPAVPTGRPQWAVSRCSGLG